MNEQKKQSNNYRNIAVVGIILVLCSVCYHLLGSGSSGDGAANRNDVDRTVQSIKDDNQGAGTAIDTAGQQIEAAGADIARADRDAVRAAAIAKQRAETVAECRNLLEQCKQNNRRAEQILAEIERANKAPAENTSTPNDAK